MCVSAGIPIISADCDCDSDDDVEASDDSSEIDYQPMLDTDITPPKVPENEEWTTITRGILLTGRYLQLLSRREDERDYCHRVIDYGTSKEDGSWDVDR